MANLLTINNDRIKEIVERASEFVTDPSVESDITELIEAFQVIDVALKQVKAQFKEQMPLAELDSLEGDIMKVTVSPSGARFKIIDESKVDAKFFKIELNSDAVDTFLKGNEKLPEGINYNESRGISVRLTIKKGAHA